MMIIRKILPFCFCLLAMMPQANAQKGPLEAKLSGRNVSDLILPATGWVSYPAYLDRAAWDKMTGDRREDAIKAGEKFLNYNWEVVKATDYLAFERTGSREIMQNPFGNNNTALASLFMAEMAEGKGRFMDQIVNGVWQTCEMSTWVLSAHLPTQKSKRSLPDLDEVIIDLTSGDLGSMMSWIHHFLSKEFDKINPVISARIRKEVKVRILDPYLQRSDFWWMALEGKTDQMVNNWNPWCNFNALACFLLMEPDAARRAEGVRKSMLSTDKFINYTKADGACEEGPSYWGHAAGKMYDYLQLLHYATAGSIDIFSDQKIRNMGEYIARSYIGEGWVVNFADASAKGGGNSGVIYRYGKAVGSNDMKSFAAYLEKRNPETGIEGRDLFRTMENFWSSAEIKGVTPGTSDAAFSWYPQTEFCYMRAGEAFFGAKGGYNAESHNHNDVGTFVYFLKSKPILVDAGVGTYTKFTFSSQRYTIWTMQSEYHNLPMVNGVAQKEGRDYRSKQAAFDSTSKTFSLDISGAYPTEAAVNSWQLKYRMDKNGALQIDERFVLGETRAPNRLNFLSAVEPTHTVSGKILMTNGDASVQMSYDPSVFEYAVEKVAVDDIRLSRVWGKTLYRITLLDKSMRKKGSYSISIKPI